MGDPPILQNKIGQKNSAKGGGYPFGGNNLPNSSFRNSKQFVINLNIVYAWVISIHTSLRRIDCNTLDIDFKISDKLKCDGSAVLCTAGSRKAAGSGEIRVFAVSSAEE